MSTQDLASPAAEDRTSEDGAAHSVPAGPGAGQSWPDRPVDRIHTAIDTLVRLRRDIVGSLDVATAASERVELATAAAVGRAKDSLETITALRAEATQMSSAFASRRQLFWNSESVRFTPGGRAYSIFPDTAVKRTAPDRQASQAKVFLSVFREALSEAEDHLAQADGVVFKGRLRRRSAEMLERATVARIRLRALVADARAHLRKVEAQAAVQIREMEAQNLRDITEVRRTAEEQFLLALEATRGADTQLLPYHREWSAWTPDMVRPGHSTLGLLHVGTLTATVDPRLGDASGFGAGMQSPFLADPRRGIHIRHQTPGRGSATGIASSILLRSLAMCAPGDVRLTLFDPVGLGDSVSSLLELAEYDADLIGGKVWSEERDLDARLSELTAHIELVTQKYLRTEFTDINEYNVAADEVAEPYRIFVAVGFPKGFTESTFEKLVRIARNGPRCGVSVLLVQDLTVPEPHGVRISELPDDLVPITVGETVRHTEGTYTMHCDVRYDEVTDAAPAITRAIVDVLGRGSANKVDEALGFARTIQLFSAAAARGIDSAVPPTAAGVVADDETTWWRTPTTTAVTTPIGKRGARDVATLTLDSGNFPGAIIVGRPGSGKSVLIHTMVAGMTTLHGPEQLELHLIDFKEGVEFKVYAAEALPHARTVAIESDREFGLSVLQSIADEMEERGRILRSERHVSLARARELSGRSLPRIVLVFDEFQVLFTQADKTGQRAAQLLETIIRQGRGFGVQVVLATQSLSGLDALGNHVLQLLPVKVVLPTTEDDARRVLGDSNDGAGLLVHHGDGLLNMYGGNRAHNLQFRGAITTEDERTSRVRAMRGRADAEGFARRPVVFEGGVSVSATDKPAADFRTEFPQDTSMLRLRVGSPMALSVSSDINLRREPGANLVLVARSEDDTRQSVPHAALALALASCAATGTSVHVLDWTALDDQFDAAVAPLVRQESVSWQRRRNIPTLVAQLRDEVRRRHQASDTRAPSMLLVLFGLHRARELDDGAFGAEAGLTTDLEEVFKDGPEVGIHTWAWSDTLAGVKRRLSSSAQREFSWRVSERLGSDESYEMHGSDTAESLREQQLVISNDDAGFQCRYRAFAMPGRQWLEDLVVPPTARGVEPPTTDGVER
jgi:S-DNA-T family DNA segregation ATPase FtsK/SpoIIIE